MPQALPLSTNISQASQATTNFKVIEIAYGNGYSQRAGDGYNSVQAEWTVNWENISASELGTLTAAFDGFKGTDYFTWTAPGDSSSKKWIVTTYTRSALAGSVFTVSCSLKQVFDL
jgi:phage-related protein